MKNEIFQIFHQCYPQLPVNEAILFELMDYESCDILTLKDEEQLIGFSAIRENAIILLCVKPEYQGRGYGSQLVKDSESVICTNGYQEAVLGGLNSTLFLGATSTEAEWKEMHNHFFEKCGYSADDGCFEMIMKLKEYELNKLLLPLYPANINFEYWQNADCSELLAAVKEVEEDWVQHFEFAPSIYVAMEQGRCVGFTLLSFDDITLCNDGHNKVGKVGCVGVVPQSRKQGIGLALVAHATNELKKQGCDASYIHYTYLDGWYEQLGYQAFLWFWFGKKKLY